MRNAGMTKGVALWTGQSIRDALSVIDTSVTGAAVFQDEAGRVVGFATDGDIRRALISGAQLTDPISGTWTEKPVSLNYRATVTERYRVLKERNLRHLIIVDDGGLFAGLQTFAEVESLYEVNPKRCPVVLMAGGRGARLRPLTDHTPKPMLEAAGEPLLQRTLRSLIAQGFEDFFISVGYLKEQIIDYFGDGERFGVSIRYLVDEVPSGTGGCLSLLPTLESKHFLVMNGDLVTNVDFRALVNFHDSQAYGATMVVREVSSQCDYGIVRVDGSRFVRLDEKPVEHYFINTGIYVLQASVLEALPEGEAFDMPDIFEQLVEQRVQCGVFEHRGQWIDIGTPSQLTAARALLDTAG